MSFGKIEGSLPAIAAKPSPQPEGAREQTAAVVDQVMFGASELRAHVLSFLPANVLIQHMTVSSDWVAPFLLDQVWVDRARQVARLSEEPKERIAYLLESAKYDASIRLGRARNILQLAKIEAGQVDSITMKITLFLQIIKAEAEIDPAGVKGTLLLAREAIPKTLPRELVPLLDLTEETLRYHPDLAEPLLQTAERLILELPPGARELAQFVLHFALGGREERQEALRRAKASFHSTTEAGDWLLFAEKEIKLGQLTEARGSLLKAKSLGRSPHGDSIGYLLEIAKIEQALNPQWALETIQDVKRRLFRHEIGVTRWIFEIYATIARMEAQLDPAGLEQTLELVAQDIAFFLDGNGRAPTSKSLLYPIYASGCITESKILALAGNIPSAKTKALLIEHDSFKSLAFLAIVEQEMKSDPQGVLETAKLIPAQFFREWARLKISSSRNQ